MFGWFKTKPAPAPAPTPQDPYTTLLGFDDLSYASAVYEFVENMDAATKAHVMVAYENLLPVLSACYSHARKEGKSFTVEDFIRELGPRLESYTDEVNSRRMSWSLFAAMIGRLEKLARSNEQVKLIGARTWCLLIPEIPRLKALLPNNVVWRPEEKDWWDLTKTDEALVEYGLNHTIPPVFAKTEPVVTLAEQLGLHYWPANSRIGIIP